MSMVLRRRIASPVPGAGMPAGWEALPIAGVDEAGRGPLAGPVAAAAVILDPARIPAGLDDSKRLAPAARERLFDAILDTALAAAVALAPAALIDRINVRAATLHAMRQAVTALTVTPGGVLVDGLDVPPGLVMPGRALIGGDGLVPAIQAASILAKVTRDRLMVRLADEHPAYGFERHKGYGTAAHLAALRDHGPCPQHRLSFAPVRATQRSPSQSDTASAPDPARPPLP